MVAWSVHGKVTYMVHQHAHQTLPLLFAQIHNERSGQMQHAEDIISQLDQRITTSGSETKELQVRIGRQHEKLVTQHPDAWRMSQSTGRQAEWHTRPPTQTMAAGHSTTISQVIALPT